MKSLAVEVGRFRAWETSYPTTGRSGEWECEYEFWPGLYNAVCEFVDAIPFDSWSEAELRDVLYSIARDNECQYLATTLRELHPEVIAPLARAALRLGERDDRWQMAVELGNLSAFADAEQLLLMMAHDKHEYVRRRALQSLVQIGSPSVQELALAAWHQPDECQEWSRMNALYCLHKIDSPKLESLLLETENDSRPHLRAYALRLGQGDSLD